MAVIKYDLYNSSSASTKVFMLQTCIENTTAKAWKTYDLDKENS